MGAQTTSPQTASHRVALFGGSARLEGPLSQRSARHKNNSQRTHQIHPDFLSGPTKSSGLCHTPERAQGCAAHTQPAAGPERTGHWAVDPGERDGPGPPNQQKAPYPGLLSDCIARCPGPNINTKDPNTPMGAVQRQGSKMQHRQHCPLKGCIGLLVPQGPAMKRSRPHV